MGCYTSSPYCSQRLGCWCWGGIPAQTSHPLPSSHSSSFFLLSFSIRPSLSICWFQKYRHGVVGRTLFLLVVLALRSCSYGLMMFAPRCRRGEKLFSQHRGIFPHHDSSFCGMGQLYNTRSNIVHYHNPI